MSCTSCTLISTWCDPSWSSSSLASLLEPELLESEELLEAEEAPAYLCLSDPLACSMGAVSSPRLSNYAEDPLACSIGAVSSPRLSNCADLDFLDRPNRSSADVGRCQSVRLQMDVRRSLNQPVSLSLVSLALDESHDGLV